MKKIIGINIQKLKKDNYLSIVPRYIVIVLMNVISEDL